MHPETSRTMCLLVSLALLASSEAFFLKWGSDSRQSAAQKAWVQPNMSPAYRYHYAYSPYESRKVYQIQPQAYAQPEVPQMQQIPQMQQMPSMQQMQQSMAPIPISVPAGASLTPVSLQHVQLVPCMCPVAPEEAEKLQEQVGPGPYLAQTYTQPSYTVQQPTNDNSKPINKQ